MSTGVHKYTPTVCVRRTLCSRLKVNENERVQCETCGNCGEIKTVEETHGATEIQMLLQIPRCIFHDQYLFLTREVCGCVKRVMASPGSHSLCQWNRRLRGVMWPRRRPSLLVQWVAEGQVAAERQRLIDWVTQRGEGKKSTHTHTHTHITLHSRLLICTHTHTHTHTRWHTFIHLQSA